jgi:hypothetical protein
LDGIIFSKSNPYYSKAFGNYRVTLSIILPEIESVMSLRCTENMAKTIDEDVIYSIDGIQPIPYVNRIHQQSASIERKDDQAYGGLECLDFLKISFYDINSISHSFAFENFCEVETDQISKRRRRLGASCVLTGLLTVVNPPRIVLQSFLKKDLRIEMVLHHALLSNREISRIKSFQGKVVRVLAIWWNSLGSKDIEYPEFGN